MSTRATILATAIAAGSLLVGIVPAAQAELRVSENYRLSSDPAPFRGKDAVALAANPRNPQHIVEVNANYLSQECESTVSLDGGNTWSAATPLRPPAGGGEPFVPTCRASDHLADFMFQTVEFGSGENVYVSFSTPRRTPGAGSTGEQGASILVAKSVDGGRTFGPAVTAAAGGLTSVAGPYYELPSLAVDPGAGPGRADRVIAAAREVTGFGEPGGDAVTSVSNDGGATFSGPVQVEPPGEQVAGPDSASPPVFLPDGSVAIAWRQQGQTAPIKVAKSVNGGVSWGPPVSTAIATNTASNSNTNPPQPLNSAGSSFPRLAVNEVTGTLYLVYNQGPAVPGAPPQGFQGADHFISPDNDVYLQRSLTQGTTWSMPRLINEADKKPGHESPYNPPATGVVTQTRHPDVAVAPNGRVDVVWEDRRHWYRGCVHTHQPCEEARLGDTYYAFSNNNGADFSRNKRINDRSHGNDVGYDYRFGVGWAFGPVMTHLGNSQLLVGWMDSREGNTDNDNLDIYLAKVNHDGPATVAEQTVARTDPADTSVRLSREAYPGGGESLLSSTFATRKGSRVVIVNQDNVPATLAAGVLARANLSNVLLSPPGGLPAGVKAEVARMSPAGAYVVGGEGSLSSQIVQDLVDAGVAEDNNPATDPRAQIERLGSDDDAATARAIAEELDRRTQTQKDTDVPAFNAVSIVNPASPDASAVSALAAARRLPVLFTSQDTVPEDTKAAISALDVNTALVIGGPGSISDAAVAQLPAGVTASERLGGSDQYATSRAVVAESLERGLPDNIAYVADGARPMDGALLGSTVGRATGLLMLSPAPLNSTAQGTAQASGLGARLDRLILLQPAAVVPPPGGGGPGPGGGQQPDFEGCRTASASRNVLAFSSGNDTRNGTLGNDLIFAGTGNDVIDALAGDDCVDLGIGADRGQGGPGDDLVVGGDGRDRVSGSSGNDRLSGNAGNDGLFGERGNDRLNGQSGNDRLLGGLGNDVLTGQSGNDRIIGSRGRDRLNGGRGNDNLAGESSPDRIDAGSGNDRISGGSSDDTLRGHSGNDTIGGGSGKDRISGGIGRDRISTRDGSRDRISCGRGRDTVLADRLDRVSRDCERVLRTKRKRARSSASSRGSVSALLDTVLNRQA